MFTASNSVSRLVGFTFAVLMTVVVNGVMLMTFDSVESTTTVAQGSQPPNVAVLETVTIIGRRI